MAHKRGKHLLKSQTSEEKRIGTSCLPVNGGGCIVARSSNGNNFARRQLPCGLIFFNVARKFAPYLSSLASFFLPRKRDHAAARGFCKKMRINAAAVYQCAKA
jgi:hypothetical protein